MSIVRTPCPPFPKSFPCNHTIFFPLKPTTFSPTCSIHSIQSRGVHVELLTPPASFGEIHVIVGPMFDGKTTTLLCRIKSDSSNGRFVNLHQFYLLSLCVLYTCLKFMWVVDKILARFGGWCFFFLARFMWLVLFQCQLSNMRSFRFSAELGSLTICMEMFPF